MSADRWRRPDADMTQGEGEAGRFPRPRQGVQIVRDGAVRGLGEDAR